MKGAKHKKSSTHKTIETVAGAAIGAAVAGPIGAVAGGLAVGHMELGPGHIARPPNPKNGNKPEADDPIVHVYPRCILVPFDFSPHSKRVLNFAREWATIFCAELHLLHVVEPHAAAGEFRSAPPGTVQRDVAGKARLALEQMARAEFDDSVPVRITVRKGRAYDQIAATARDIHADLIIIASQGCGGLKRALLGSTAERVARYAPCPVLILRRRSES